MDESAVRGTNAGSPKSGKLYLQEMASSQEHGMQELESTMEVLTKVELDLVYSSEKLVNFHVLLMCLLTQENDFETVNVENDYISDDSTEKALAFDLLSGFVDSEVRDLDNFMDTLQAEIVDARHKISSCRHVTELTSVMEEKLRDSEESLKQSRQQILEVMMQSTKLQRIVLAFGHENGKLNDVANLSEDGQAYNIKGKTNSKMTEQQRHILRMLEKSLARELDLEKELSESRRREEELRLKLHYTEQVSLHMEQAAEVVWGRFLEAENGAEALMGISKELVGRLQLIQFNLNSSLQRENEMKSKYQDCIEQLKTKDIVLQRLESSKLEHAANDAELVKLREEVKFLEQQLKETKLCLNNAYSSNEASEDQLNEMEIVIESLKESICIAESRAESAEAKIAQLTENNTELTEELNFHKGSASSKEKKVGSLEKQLRELELQLQHAKASSEASQEQQNMLYSAIWDMETLIEDLKSKVSKSEAKTDNAEEQCLILSETNLDLNKELDSLRARVESLETSLEKANSDKFANAKEINLRSKLIMDMVVQLATERERIQKQLSILTDENKALVEKLRTTKGFVSGKEFMVSKNDVIDTTGAKISEETLTQSLHKTYEMDEASDVILEHTNEGRSTSTISENYRVEDRTHLEASKAARCTHLKGSKAARCRNLVSVSLPILVLLLSIGVYILLTKSFPSVIFDG